MTTYKEARTEEVFLEFRETFSGEYVPASNIAFTDPPMPLEPKWLTLGQILDRNRDWSFLYASAVFADGRYLSEFGRQSGSTAALHFSLESAKIVQ